MTTTVDRTHRERAQRSKALARQKLSEIPEIKPCKNPIRRNLCRLDLRRFLVTYFPNSTGKHPFSDAHLKMVARIQDCVLNGGSFVNAVARGMGKSTVSENSVLWAILYGHRRSVVFFGAEAKAADENMESIKMELECNDLLMDDFPEVCAPVRHVEGKALRATHQTWKGRRTFMEWSADRVVLAKIPRAKAAGAVLVVRGISAGFRGLKKKLPDGNQLRPDLVIADDAQTDEGAGSLVTVHKTLGLFRKGISFLGSHQTGVAIVLNATVIQEGDVIDSLLADPAWQGERIPLVRKMPDAHQSLWLGRYKDLRQSYPRDVPGAQRQAWLKATEFYLANREAMDAGAEVAWEYAYKAEKGEASALQHAENILIDQGEEAFASECQQQPLPKIRPMPDDLKPDEIRARLTRCPRGNVPVGSTRLTAMIDVGGDLLWYAVVAWNESFGGAVIDYGPWPDQGRAYVFNAEARPTLKDVTGVASLEGSIYAGLERLTGQILGQPWGALRIERCLIDDGWGLSTDVVQRFCRQSVHAAVLLPSKGMGISASMLPISDWPDKRNQGERKGDSWVIRPPERGKPRRVLFDANRWKSFLAARLKQPVGEPGALLLFGDDAVAHKMIADHCCAEHRVHTSGRGRQVEEWKLPPNRPDNHLFDTLVGAAVAASILGIQVGGLPKKLTTKPRMTMQQMQAAARAGR